ncbi:HET-domain-containing protein [Bimuria novae-zelandiae CBS 107.79]|uniref:HET-domain-containing protein n=1 Tax=Bimuria novae-zelandiae CBS 107.79 TaxID=1447943 RepID=A0A6A5VZ39_9PLEO|nr:HET-domain-containing protein [Bimuria novae-zelandiae CBS 107.79]
MSSNAHFPLLSDALAPAQETPSEQPPLRSPFASKNAQKKRLRPYVTLSHRWAGPYQDFLTTKANISLRTNILRYTDLPRTWRDAVTITRRLGFEYLWIDSLCLVQDDAEELREEIKKMEDIYSRAALTIAATSAEGCEAGFLRRYPPFGSQARSTSSFTMEVKLSGLNTRGWVFQERALSWRRIHFGKLQTYWECGNSMRCGFIRRLELGSHF